MEMLFERMEANNVAFVILNSSNRWLGIALVRDFIIVIAEIVCIGMFRSFYWLAFYELK